MNKFIFLSGMSKVYIVEIVVLIVIVILISIICNKGKILEKIPKKNSNLLGRTGSALIEIKKEKKARPLPIVILICGILVIAFQYIFEKPQIKDEIKINVGSNIEESDFKIMYHNNNIFNESKWLSPLDTNIIGEYYCDIEIPYGKNKKEIKRVKVIITDTEAPIISLDYKDGEKVSYTKDLTIEGYTVTDNYDKDIMSKVKVSIKSKNEKITIISYYVKDSSGNIAQDEVEVEIVDDVAPSLVLNGDENITINLHEEYKELGATAKDEKDGDVTDKIKIDGYVDTNIAGEYIINYTVSDSSGNNSQIKRVVNVVDLKGVICLTFDDGPSANITPKILDILNRKGIKATFFIVNYNEKTEYLVKRIIAEGHTIGIHGYSHDYSKIYTSEDVFMNNVETLRKKIKDSTGVDTKLMRFPGGSSNTVSKKYCKGIMTSLAKRVSDDGYRYFDWNVSSEDAGGAYTSTEVYNNVVNYLSKERINVVLMHDATDKVWTLNALENIIDYGLSHGYKFSNITEDIPDIHHRINN